MDLTNLYLDAFGLLLNEEKTELLRTRTSYLGTPILKPITFLAKKFERLEDYGIRDLGTYPTTPENKPKIEILPYGNFTLPASSIASFSRRKILSKTPMHNGRGTIKQIYGFEDYRITIRGFLLPEPSHPQGLTTIEAQEKALIKWDNAQGNIPILGEEFNGSRDIQAIAIQDIDFPALRGKPKIRPFVINALSASHAEEEADSFLEVIKPKT